MNYYKDIMDKYDLGTLWNIGIIIYFYIFSYVSNNASNKMILDLLW